MDIEMPRVDDDRYAPIMFDDTPPEEQGAATSLEEGMDQGAEISDEQ
jgi:hypothetical protein